MSIIFNKKYKSAYSGNESYKYIDELIKKSHNLKIISPYISLFYAKKIAYYSKHKKISIITFKPQTKNELTAFKYLTKLNNLLKFIKLLIYTILLESAAILLKFYSIALILFVFFIIVFILFYLIYGPITSSNISIKISKKFIHEKIYIGNDSAIIGSANLTYNGMHKNIEYVEVIKDKNKINSLKDHFNSLWSQL